MTAAIAPEIAAELGTFVRNQVEEIIVLPREITEGQSIYRELDTFAVANAKEAGIPARFLVEAPNRRFVAQHDASSLLLQIAIAIPADLSSSLIVMAGQYVWAQIRGAMHRGLIADESKSTIRPRHRHQTLPPPHRRRPNPCLRKPRPSSRPGLTMTIYTAEPDSPTAHALALLASWAATQQLSSIDAQTQPPAEQLPRPVRLDGIGP